jgi:hypothetical protein
MQLVRDSIEDELSDADRRDVRRIHNGESINDEDYYPSIRPATDRKKISDRFTVVNPVNQERANRAQVTAATNSAIKALEEEARRAGEAKEA